MNSSSLLAATASISTLAIARAASDHEGAREPDDLPDLRMTVTVVRDVGELRAQIGAWRRLAETALEANAFYEPFMLLPAIEALAEHARLEFVIVTAPSRKYPDGPPVWCGFFPLERCRRRGSPAPYLRLWKHIHCFLCTPLVRTEVAEEALTALLDWLHNEAGEHLLKLDSVAGEGPFHQLLIETLRRRQTSSWVSERHARALLRRSASEEAFLLGAMSRKRRHETRRLAKRFAEQGCVEYQTLQRADDLEAWIDGFFQLESAGWKGRGGTALACTDADRRFFTALAYNAFEERRLLMSALRLDGKLVAQKCSVLAGAGSFALKIAFAEEWSRFSPGVLLEMHNIRRLHETEAVEWMDSCAQADHPMINQLWKDRRTIESVWLSSPTLRGELTLALLPLARLAGQRLRVRKAGK